MDRHNVIKHESTQFSAIYRQQEGNLWWVVYRSQYYYCGEQYPTDDMIQDLVLQGVFG